MDTMLQTAQRSKIEEVIGHAITVNRKVIYLRIVQSHVKISEVVER